MDNEFKAIYQTVSQHITPVKGVAAEPQDVYEFIRNAVNDKVIQTSQEPPEDEICKSCQGRCDYLDHNGVTQTCDTCKGYGIIKHTN